MKIFMFILAILAGGFQFGDDEEVARPVGPNGQFCITAERIIKPIRSWKVLKTEIRYQGKSPFMEVTAHNPLNKKTPTSVDARFILSIDPGNPTDPQRFNLVMATYYNDKANVVFRRIYQVHEVTVKNKQQKFPVQTPCFAREIVQIIEITPEEIKVPDSSPDGGTK